MTDQQKLSWVSEALQEKQEQLIAKSSFSGDPWAKVRTTSARKASSGSSPTQQHDVIEVNAGSWALSWMGSAKKSVAGGGGFGCTWAGQVAAVPCTPRVPP